MPLCPGMASCQLLPRPSFRNKCKCRIGRNPPVTLICRGPKLFRGSAIGSTPAFGAGYPGSSPGPGAKPFAISNAMNTPDLALGVIWYIVFLFSTTCHEAAHALVAKLGGDTTAAE